VSAHQFVQMAEANQYVPRDKNTPSDTQITIPATERAPQSAQAPRISSSYTNVNPHLCGGSKYPHPDALARSGSSPPIHIPTSRRSSNILNEPHDSTFNLALPTVSQLLDQRYKTDVRPVVRERRRQTRKRRIPDSVQLFEFTAQDSSGLVIKN
jgi:hypothetical protein